MRKWIIIPLVFFSCGGEEYVPKPYAYPRMVLPQHEYELFDSAFLPYRFEKPLYSKMDRDFQGEYRGEHPTWINMNFPTMNATLHITHHTFSNWEHFDSLVQDTRKLVFKHIQRADDIVEQPLSEIQPGLKGLLYDIQGNTATNLNFFITDSSKNFFRGALYFNKQTKADSVAPVYRFIREDVMHLLKTFEWKK